MNQTLLSLLLLTAAVLLTKCSAAKKEELAAANTSKAATIDLLVGVYTGNGSNGIYQLQFDPATGQLSDSLLLVKTNNPSYLAISADRQYVYSVNETEEGNVSSFRWNQQANQLIPVSSQPTGGAHPCYVDLSADEKMLAVANYSSGNLAVFSLATDGTIQPNAQLRQHEGSGPVDPNQKGPHAHCSLFKANFLYVVDLGIDKVLTYPVLSDGQLGEVTVALALDAGDGPRHLVFHPSKPMAFLVNELSSSVVSLRADFENGTLEPISKLSTLPEGFTDKNFDADVHLSSDGKFLYATNRGHNSIAMFGVADDGSLSVLGHEPTRGGWPRNFTLSPDENFLLVANQESHNIVVFKRDPATGLLSYSGYDFTISKPVCLKF